MTNLKGNIFYDELIKVHDEFKVFEKSCTDSQISPEHAFVRGYLLAAIFYNRKMKTTVEMAMARPGWEHVANTINMSDEHIAYETSRIQLVGIK